MQQSLMLGYFYGFISVFFWSFNVIIARYLVGVLSPIQISFGRWFFAAVFLLPFSYKIVLREKEAIIKHWKTIFLSSLISTVLMNTLVYQAGHTTSAVNMALLGTTGPIFLVVFSVLFFHTKILKKQIFGFGVTLLGVLVVVTKGDLMNLKNFTFVTGDFWMLLNAALFGLYGILQTNKIEGVSAISLVSVVVLIGNILLFPLTLLSLNTHPVESLPQTTVWILVYMGIFPSLLSYFCWNKTLEILGGLKSSLIYYLIAILSMIEASFFLKEKVSGDQLFGGILVLFGVFIASYSHPSHDAEIKRI